MKRCSVLGSSELPSESLSKRSTHQFPRLLISLSLSTFATCGTTTAKGLYANSFFELNHYAIGGVRAQALSVLVLSTSTTGSSRRVPPPRGSRLDKSLLGTPPSFSLACPLVTYEAFPCTVDSPAADPPLVRVRFPLRLCLRLHFCRRLCAVGTCSRASGRVSPGAIDTEFGHRNSFVFLTESLIHNDPSTGASGRVFPGRDRVPVGPLWFQGPHSYVALARPDQRPRARVVRGSFGPEASFTEWLGRSSQWIWVEITCPAFLGVPLCPT